MDYKNGRNKKQFDLLPSAICTSQPDLSIVKYRSTIHTKIICILKMSTHFNYKKQIW